MASASADRPIRQALFLARYAQLGNLALAAEQAAVSKRVVHHWKATDPAFAEAFAEAQAQAVEVLEAEARRRAVEGVEKPVYQGGKQVGTVREYSDVLLIFLLKGARPDKYRDHALVNVDTGAKVVTIVYEDRRVLPGPGPGASGSG